MPSGRYRASESGVKVFEDWRDNFIVDRDNPILTWKAALPREQYTSGIVAGLPRLGSENSEDALTWNYFRTFETAGRLLGGLAQQIPSWSGDETEDYTALFWGRDPERGGVVDEGLQVMLDRIEPWGKGGQKQQTESDLLVLGGSAVLAVESKLGTPGACLEAWNRKKLGMRPEYQDFLQAEKLECFTSDWNWQTDGQRFYQLMRNWILANALARERGAKPYLGAVVNEKTRNLNGRSHAEEFAAFKLLLPEASRATAVLLTWQDLYRGVLHAEDEDGPEYYSALKAWMKNHTALQLATAEGAGR